MWYFYCILLEATCVHQTNASTKFKSPSIILNLKNEWINWEIKRKQVANLIKQNIDDLKKKNWCRSHDTTFKNCWCIWPTMKIHADTDSTSSNFSHFFCYTLAHPFYVKHLWPPSIVKQIIFNFLPLLGVSLLQSWKKTLKIYGNIVFLTKKEEK